MSIPLDERCDTCKFHLYIALEHQHPKNRVVDKAACLRYPPSANGLFPMVEALGTWCGEWQKE